MDSTYSSHPTLPLSSEDEPPRHYHHQQQIPLELIDFHRPFDIETRLDDTSEFIECCPLDHTPTLGNKIVVVSSSSPNSGGRPNGLPSSEFSEECEMDGSYTEFVETQWTKGASSRSSGSTGSGSSSSSSSSSNSNSSEGDADSDSKQESIDAIHEIRSESESAVVSAPLHGPSVKCVCVCNKKGCEFMNKPYDTHSIRESPVSRMSVSYKLSTWLRSLTRYGRTRSPSIDQVDACSKVHPERKLRIIQLLKKRPSKEQTVTCGGVKSEPKALSAIRRYIPKIAIRKTSVSSDGSEETLRSCEVSVPRTLGVLLGLSFILLGVTYDHGVKHGVDDLLQDCWSWLRTSYMNFGDEFVSYNSIFFRMTNTDALYGEPYPRYGPNNTKKAVSNLTQFQEAINNADPRFLFILEGLKLSVQINFFSIDENSEKPSSRVIVHEKGPLFFRISFRRTSGLQIDYVPERSRMTLSTPFQVYDLMKMIILSNELPYFGFHMHDHHKTTPKALLTMIIDNLKKFKVDTTFLSSIQAQIEKSRIKRSPTAAASSNGTLPKDIREPTERPTQVTQVSRSPPPTSPAQSTTATLYRQSESGTTLPYNNQSTLIAALERIRRSTEEPTLVKASWKSLEEISSKIFLPLPLDTKKTVLLPVPFIRRNLTLKYRHQVNMLGLPGYQFILGNDKDKEEPHGKPELYPSLSYSRVKDGEELDPTSNPHIQRHKNNERKKHHRHSKHQTFLDGDSHRNGFDEVLGVVDLEPFLLETIGRLLLMGRHLEHYPFWLSAPHFLSLTSRIKHVNKTHAPPSETLPSTSSSAKVPSLDQGKPKDAPPTTNANNILVGVDGLDANESRHGSFIYYHPILGVPINASLAVQVGVRPPEGMLHAHKLVPILWARAQVEEIPGTLWYILWAACHLRETIMAILIMTGMFIITCSLTCGKKGKGTREGPNSA
ncbi:uncharacterized protein LOC135206994 [Macrobrachium nipponense]|uniref:uncharacterized protein LOC135206994 n=1 Tax=Macrobrachium nipponense TaxID=159736 RepID=UPI0030C8CBB3